MASFNLVEWVNTELEASLEPDALSEPETHPGGLPVSVLSSSYSEVVNTPDATFWGLLRVSLAADVGTPEFMLGIKVLVRSDGRAEWPSSIDGS